jgi:hypothetical protein
MKHKIGARQSYPIALSIGLLSLLSLNVMAIQAMAVTPSSTSAPRVSEPSIVPPLDTGIIQDPTGTYTIQYIGNGQMSMNRTAYDKLLNDPYSGLSATVAKMNATTVILNPANTSGDFKDTPTASSGNWSGGASGNCTFTASGAALVCSSASYTLQTSGVYDGDLTWDGSCYGGASGCATGFWTGLSGSNSGTGNCFRMG